MKFVIPTLVALLMVGTTFAQTPTKPAKPAKPAQTAQPAQAAERAPTGDEELALAALEGLMAQSPERALPIIKKVLAGPQSTVVKQRAMFVLSQIDSQEARDILTQTARSPDSALRGEAIRSIGIGGDPRALDSLQSIYSAGSPEVKKEVLQAWLIAGRKEAVYQVALNAKSEEEANEAIRLLGVMGATDELRKLGEKPNAASGLVEAYALSGDLTSLRKIAESSGDPAVRINAIRMIGIIRSDAARTALREIYLGAKDAEIREAALQGMLISGDDQGVLSLYKAAKTPEEKRSLLRTLTTMDGDVALQAIDAALEKR